MYGLLNWLPTFFNEYYSIELADLGSYTLLPYLVQGGVGAATGVLAGAQTCSFRCHLRQSPKLIDGLEIQLVGNRSEEPRSANFWARTVRKPSATVQNGRNIVFRDGEFSRPSARPSYGGWIVVESFLNRGLNGPGPLIRSDAWLLSMALLSFDKEELSRPCRRSRVMFTASVAIHFHDCTQAVYESTAHEPSKVCSHSSPSMLYNLRNGHDQSSPNL